MSGKPLICLLLCACSLATSAQLQKGGCILRGQLEGAEDLTLYLLPMDASLNVQLPGDSVRTRNGTFSFHEKANGPGVYQIYSPALSLPETMIVLLEPGVTQIHIDAHNWNKFQVSGSPRTNAYFAFMKEYAYAFYVFNEGWAHTKFPRFRKDTVDGKIKRTIVETYNCYLLKTDTTRRTDTPVSVAGRSMDYGLVTFENRDTTPAGDWIISRYGDTTELHMNRVVRKYLGINRNSEVGAIIAYQHFTIRNLREGADTAYHFLSPSARNSFYGKSLEDYIAVSKLSLKADFSFTDISGGKTRFSSLKSKYIYVHFWASWCGSCRPANKDLAAVYNKYDRTTLEFVNISYDMTRAAWEKAIRMDSLPGLHTSQLKGFDNPIGRLFHVRALPAGFLLDGQRNIVSINPSPGYLESLIQIK